MHFIYFLWIFILFLSLHAGIFFFLLDTDKKYKYPYCSLSILSVIHLIFAVLTYIIRNKSIILYNIHSLCLAVLPISSYVIYKFVMSLYIDNKKTSKYIQKFFLFFAIILMDLIILARPVYKNGDISQLLIYGVLKQNYIFVSIAVYYFCIAILTIYALYKLLKQRNNHKSIQLLIFSFSIYFAYILFINTLLYRYYTFSIVDLTFFTNLLPLCAIIISVRKFGLLGVTISDLTKEIYDNSNEAVCIMYENSVSYANKKFYNLFFDTDYTDLYDIKARRILPRDFFTDEAISNKFAKVNVSYIPDTIDILFNKKTYDDKGYLINIIDISFVRDMKQKVKYIEDNSCNIVSNNSTILALSERNKELEEETKNFIDAQNQKILLETTDHLTGLNNRSFFSQISHNILEQSDPVRDRHIVLYLDLDNFKTINDTLGHDIGDEVLKSISNILKESVPPNSIIARIGGDEFLIFVKHNGLSQNVEYLVDKIAKKIISNFKKPLNISDNIINTSCSMGFSIYPSCGKDVETLIKNADIAMYVSKNNGKNCYSIFEETKQNSVLNEFNLTNDMIMAIQKNQFKVYYQPQVEIVKGHPVINTVESLIRWFHPEKGVISPGIFIPIAERSGYINEIAIWMLKQVCEQIKTWNKQGVFVYVSINFSTPKFEKEHLYESIKLVLSETKLNPKFIKIEVSEKYLVKDIETTVATLEAIKKLGVSIVIDNFGIEYSSLNYLKYIPVDYIKLDMGFIHGIGSNKKDEAIILALIELSKSSNIKIIAEGVETQAQYNFLIKHGLNSMQGYYFYKPMTNDEFTNLYRGASM